MESIITDILTEFGLTLSGGIFVILIGIALILGVKR